MFYKWYRNEQPIPEKRNEFVVFPNGTLMIAYSKKAPAVYHCVVDGMHLDLGALRTKSCTVLQASKCSLPYLKSYSIVYIFCDWNAYLITIDLVLDLIPAAGMNVTAEMGSSVVLTCPFYSVPDANVTWQFANSSDIHYNNNRRVKVLSILCCRIFNVNCYRFHIFKVLFN